MLILSHLVPTLCKLGILEKKNYSFEYIIIYSSVYSIGLDMEDLAPPLVNDVEHTKLYAGYGCLILEILLERGSFQIEAVW